MLELAQTEYRRVVSLFTPLKHYLTIDAVLQHTTPGRVWVDERAQPQTAVLWANHRVYLGGQVSGALPAFFAQQFRPAAAAAGIAGISLYLPPDWMLDVGTLFPETYPAARPRLYFRQDARQRSWPVSVPDDLTLRPVDAALLVDDTLTNRNYVTDEMVSERPSITEFLAKSFGCCLVHKNEIVGWCMSEYNTGRRCELGIETAVSFRRRGLATLMASAVIRHALAQDIHDIGWVCWAENHASVATAQRLGFQQEAAGTAYDVIFDPALARA